MHNARYGFDPSAISGSICCIMAAMPSATALVRDLSFVGDLRRLCSQERHLWCQPCDRWIFIMNMINPSDIERRFDVALSEIGSDMIQGFHRLWLRLCRTGVLPSRADIDPANFKRILPNVILADIEHDPFRVRYRLCGTLVAEFSGNLTGRYLDEIGSPELWNTASYLHQYRVVAVEGRPVSCHDWVIGQFGTHHFQTGIWPLASDGHTVDMCIAVEDYRRLRRSEIEPAAAIHPF